MAELKFEKTRWEWNEGYKLKKLGGENGRAVSPLVVEFNGKRHIAYIYSPSVKEGVHYLADKFLRKEEHRRKLFVKIHGILKNVPCELLLKMSGKQEVLSNARKYGVEGIIKKKQPLDYLVGDCGVSAHSLLKRHYKDVKLRRALLIGIGISLGRLCALGYQPRVMNFHEFIVIDEKNLLEMRLTDVFDLGALSQIGPGIAFREMEEDAEIMVLGALYIAGFSKDQIPTDDVLSCVYKGVRKGYKEFS